MHFILKLLVIHDPHVAGHNFVLEARPGGDVYPVPVVGDDYDCAFEAHLERRGSDNDGNT